MLKKRIIPCLDIKNGRTVKGINFESIRDAGDPIELAAHYAASGADELVFLDITATVEKRKTLVDLVRRIAKVIDIPFTVGGGISSIDDVDAVISAGADKVSINSGAVRTPDLISTIANRYGSQCVVVAVDTNIVDETWKVFVNGGRKATSLDTIEWVRQVEALGGGEILLTSMQGDGTKQGYSLHITRAVAAAVEIPVIASGGAGSIDHFVDVFKSTEASAALAASIFHYNEIGIMELKRALEAAAIPMRLRINN